MASSLDIVIFILLTYGSSHSFQLKIPRMRQVSNSFHIFFLESVLLLFQKISVLSIEDVLV